MERSLEVVGRAGGQRTPSTARAHPARIPAGHLDETAPAVPSTTGGLRMPGPSSEATAVAAFYGELTRTVAASTHAARVVFLELDGEHVRGVPDGFGFPPAEVAALALPCTSDDGGPMADVVFGNRPTRVLEAGPVMAGLCVDNAIVVGCRSGSEPFGVLLACDSTRPGGFGEPDLEVLRVAGLAATFACQRRRATEALALRRTRSAATAARRARRAERENHVKLDLLALVSAEMRAVLSSVSRDLSLAIAEDGPPRHVAQRLGEALQRLPAQFEEMSRVVGEMRDPDRLPGTRIQLERERIQVAELVHEVCMALRLLLGSPVEVVETVAASAVVEADRRALTTILVTVIGAAMKRPRDGHRVAVDGRVGEGVLRVTVGPEEHRGSGGQQPQSDGAATLELVSESANHCRLLARMHGGDLEVAPGGAGSGSVVLTLPVVDELAVETVEPVVNPAEPARAEQGLRVYESDQVVQRDGRRTRLSWTEWQLFSFLWGHPNIAFSRTELAAGAWGEASAQRAAEVEMYISRVRRRVERDPRRPELIVTLRGQGYQLSRRV